MCLAVPTSTFKLLSVKNAHSTTKATPAMSPVSRMAKGMPTIPAPMMALTRLEVAPEMEDLCSTASRDSFLMSLDVPPGVDTWTSLRGVEGAKKGELVWASFFLGLGGMVLIVSVDDGAEEGRKGGQRGRGDSLENDNTGTYINFIYKYRYCRILLKKIWRERSSWDFFCGWKGAKRKR